jgi:hypothetical protein
MWHSKRDNNLYYKYLYLYILNFDDEFEYNHNYNSTVSFSRGSRRTNRTRRSGITYRTLTPN